MILYSKQQITTLEELLSIVKYAPQICKMVKLSCIAIKIREDYWIKITPN